jgi:hypothetical protein
MRPITFPLVGVATLAGVVAFTAPQQIKRTPRSSLPLFPLDTATGG